MFLCKLQVPVLLEHKQALYIKLEVKCAICVYTSLWDNTVNIHAYWAFTRKYTCVYRFYLYVNFLYTKADDGHKDGDTLLTCKCTICQKYLTVYLFNIGRISRYYRTSADKAHASQQSFGFRMTNNGWDKNRVEWMEAVFIKQWSAQGRNGVWLENGEVKRKLMLREDF